jgi:phytoene dehydrogenase-like protein
MNKKVVIIGGGVAGLSAGIYGQKNGYDTEVIEMHTVPGGQCTAWYRKGYRFDYCLHWLVGTTQGPFHDVWKDTDVITDRVKIVDHEVHTKIFDEQGNDFTVYTNIDRWEQYLIGIAPEDATTIKKMCAEMRKVSLLEPFSDPPELRGLWDYVRAVAKMLPALIVMMKYGKKNCRDYFRELNFKNPRLAFFFDHLYAERDFSALAFLMMLGWFYRKNAGYLIGGSLPLAGRMAEKYKALGGKLTLGKEVKKIIVEDHTASGVVLSDGMERKADYVVSAADGHATLYDMLEGKYLSGELEEAYGTWPLFTPIVQVSFGIAKEIKTEYPVRTYLAKGRKIGGTLLETGYTIMNYCFDPTMAPEGKTVIVVRYESPWELWKDLEGDAYKTEKKRIEKDSIAIMEKHMPGITAHIEVVDIATPRSDVRYTGVWKGSYEGFMPTSKNITKSLTMTLPGLKNFYMCGQWLFPGGGLPPAALSGKWVMQLICKDKKKFIR